MRRIGYSATHFAQHNNKNNDGYRNGMDRDIARLRAELSSLRAFFDTKSQQLEARIQEIERRLAPAAEAPAAPEPTVIASPPAIPPPPAIPAASNAWQQPARLVVADTATPASASARPQPETPAAVTGTDAMPSQGTRAPDSSAPATVSPQGAAAQPAAESTVQPTAEPAVAAARAASQAPTAPRSEPLHSERPRHASHSPADAGKAPTQPDRWSADADEPGPSWLAAGAGSLLGPAAVLLDKAQALYEHYRSQGKAAVFFLTLAGLLAMVGGFGYLLQFSFTYLGAGAKVALGFLATLGIGAIGVRLAVRKPEFLDYASSLIGLATVLGYLCTYVMGPYYGLTGEATTFAAWALVSAAAYVLALIFATRVVAVITLIGGALTPFALGLSGPLGAEFLLYLLLLSAASLHLAHRIAWPVLAHLAFVLSVGLIEYTELDASSGGWALAALLHGFFYLFNYFWCCRGLALRDKVPTVELGALTANLFYFIYALGQSGLSPLALGIVFALDAALLAAAFVGLRALRSELAGVLSVQIALLAACAIFMGAPNDASRALLWGLEGLALLWLGRRHAALALRAEGLLVLAPALGWMGLLAAIGLASDGLQPGAHWLALAALGGLLWAAYRLLGGLGDQARDWEQGLTTVLKEGFSVWALLGFYAAAWLALGTEAALLAGLPLLWGFWRARRHRLHLTEVLALIQPLLLAAYVGLSLLAVGSLHAADHAPWLWLAVLLLVASAWTPQTLYSRYYPDGSAFALAETLRLAQYLLPIAWLLGTLPGLLPQFTAPRASLASPYTVDLLLIGAWLGLAAWRLRRERTTFGVGAMLAVMRNVQSLWFTVSLLYAVQALAPGWAGVAAIVPAGLLLWRALRRRLAVSEALAWGHLLLFVLTIASGALRAGSLHLSDLDWPARLAWVELLVAGWGGLWLYQRMGRDGALLGLAQLLRTLVYLALPLVFLPKVLRYWPQWLPLALWGSAALCWGLHRYSRDAALRTELWILTGVAALFGIGGLANSLIGHPDPRALAAVLAGAGFWFALWWLEGGSDRRRFAQSEFRRLVSLGLYFPALAALALVVAFTGSESLGLVAAGGYWLWIGGKRSPWPPLRGNAEVALTLAWATLAIAVLAMWGLPAGPLDLLVVMIALPALGYAAHARRARRRSAWPVAAGYLGFHALLLLSYTGVVAVLFGDAWAAPTTIALVLHATAMLFLTLRPRFGVLLKPSVALFGLAAVKVLFYDMTGFATPHKVLALMSIGAILLVAAYQFQRLRQRLEPAG